MSGPGSLREGRHQPDPSFVSLRSLSAGSEGWREGRQAEARLDRGRADIEGSPRKRQLPRAIHAGTKAAADPGVRRKSRSEVCNNHGGRRPSIPAKAVDSGRNGRNRHGEAMGASPGHTGKAEAAGPQPFPRSSP